jgi:hypothetical protein
MELPCGNFFEVTINSNKLYAHIQQLNDQLTQQKRKLEQFDTMTSNFEDKLMVRVNEQLASISLDC